jgi:hypothetical protein
VLPKQLPNGLKDETKNEILNSDLWATLFRGGFVVGRLQRSYSGKHVSVDLLRVINSNGVSVVKLFP